MRLLPRIVFVCVSFYSFVYPTIARGGQRTADHSGRVRHILTESGLQNRRDVARDYMSNDDLEKAVKAFSRRCRSISRIYSIGKSVKGVPLWVIEISDMPGKEEPEPAFKFIGNVHGDEPVGRELLIYFANWLCENFGKDSLATLLVENVHIHILPSMNPDGFSLRRRGNANDIDLNRDFPDQFLPINDDVAARQPETKAIMKWLKEIHFTASASLHGGALVANYPWDGTQNTRNMYNSCPDDEVFRYMATVYSHSHYNMSLSKEFREGITNGASWYPIYGGMQDWNYIHGGCFELTLEVSDNKWPPVDELRAIWSYNKMSLLNLVGTTVKSGVHGRVYSSENGKPLPAAITIANINYSLEVGSIHADYHRLLAPGKTYEVTASSPGYKSKTTKVVLEDKAVTLDFILDPDVVSDHKQQLRMCCSCGSWGFSQVLWRFNFGVYLIGVVLLVMICKLLERRLGFSKFLKYGRLKAGDARSVV